MPCNTHNVNMKVKYTNCKADCLLALKEREKKNGRNAEFPLMVSILRPVQNISHVWISDIHMQNHIVEPPRFFYSQFVLKKTSASFCSMQPELAGDANALLYQSNLLQSPHLLRITNNTCNKDLICKKSKRVCRSGCK